MALLCAASPAFAIVQTMMGDQDFNDGALIFNLGDYNNAQSGEPSPFGTVGGPGGFLGDDTIPGATFSAQWTQTFNPADIDGDMIPDGMGGFTTGFNFLSLEFGLYDHDTDADGTQLQTFTVNGVDVSAFANTYFEDGTPDNDTTTFGTSPAGDNSRFNIYRFVFDIDDPDTAALASAIRDSAEFQNGEIDVVLAFQGPSLVISPDPDQGNGVGIDYSLLRINTPAGDDFPPIIIPEPATATLGLIALAGLAARTRRRQ
jgi:hypothetical protein